MTNQRRIEVLNLLEKNSALTVEQLAESLNVSEVTIRRDLVQLEKEGLIVRHRGGATLPGTGFEPMFKQRQKENLDLKQSIAKYAASQIQDGEVIALDVGTTTAELAKELLKKSNLTIFTSSLQVTSILSRSNHSVYLIGGKLRQTEMSMVGSIALDTIMKFNYDRFYLSLAGISNESGPTDYSIEEAEVKKAFITRSKQVIALVDKSKFGKSSLIKVCDLDEITEIITNKDENNSIQKTLRYKGKITFV